MEMKNLTPHEIVVVVDGRELHFPPSGTVARCTATREVVEYLEVQGVKIPINRTTFGEVENLPEPQEGAVYIVSSIVAQAMAGKRNDLFVPDDAVRDEQGRIKAVKAFAKI
ncbi:hypothetical protein [Caldisericum sp.]|uniref:hypothetical protein n=1 Tax=Caldisericum sp. TaxID=2499687 RepID=UPI003D12256B